MNIPLSKILFAQDASLSQLDITPNFVPITNANSYAKLDRTVIKCPTGSSQLTITPTIDPTSTPSDVDLVPYTANTNGTMTQGSAVTFYYGAGAKLTVVDEDRSNFAVSENIIRGAKESSVSIHYSGASVGEGEYISAIIKDTYGNPLYHARLKPVGESTSGELSMIIPNDIECGEYTLVVYNELERGAYNTNYAGYDTLVLVVYDEDEQPTVTNVYTNATGTNFKFTANDNWDLYQVTSYGGEKIRDLANNNVTTNMMCGGQASILIEDLAGNITTVGENAMLVDQTPPTVAVTYSGGRYTLTVSDNESGVWKITNSDGTTVYHDYSTSTNSATT